MGDYPMYTHDDNDYNHLLNLSTINLTMSYDNYIYDSQDDIHSFHNVIRIAVASIYALLCVIGIVGNLFVMVTIGLTAELRTVRYALVFNLSVASMFMMLLYLPFTVYSSVSENWPFGDALCKLSFYLHEVSRYVSVYTLLTLAAYVFDLLAYPCLTAIARLVTNKETPFMLIGIVVNWLVCLACLSPLITLMKTGELSYGSITFCFWAGTEKDYGILSVCSIILAYIIPLSIAITFYVCAIVMSSRSQEKKLLQTSGDEGNDRYDAVTYLSMSIIGAIFWGPKLVFDILQSSAVFGLTDAYHFQYFIVVFHLLTILSFIPPTVFPMIIFARSRQFRRCFQSSNSGVKPNNRLPSRDRADYINLQTTK